MLNSIEFLLFRLKWEHRITLEKMVPYYNAVELATLPVCTEGQNRGPLEQECYITSFDRRSSKNK